MCARSVLDICTNNLNHPRIVGSSWLDGEEVASFVSIQMYVDENAALDREVNFPESIGLLTNKQYELTLRQAPVYHCVCCDRFLFENQVHTIPDKHLNDIMVQLHIGIQATLC